MPVVTLPKELSENLDMLAVVERWQAEGRKLVLATVIETWGSAPRPIGSHLIIDENGEFEGSVSGGCVEGAVVSEAMDVLDSGEARKIEFGVADETAWRVGLSCGGKISVYLQPLATETDHSLISLLNKTRSKRQPAALLTNLATGSSSVILFGSDAEDPSLSAAFEAGVRSGKSGQVQSDGGEEYFLSMQVPATRIVVIGAVHITQALVPIAQTAGFDMTIVDPRTAFASQERFPDTPLLAEWPEDVMAQLELDPFTAVVAITHDPKIDDLPLQQALRAGCFYVGALGSRKTHAKRKERFHAAGVNEEDFARIKAPIGLDIGGVTPAEIAVAILAEIIVTLRGSKAEQKKAV
ncbi:putative xanthine dehydrogenase subunit A [Pseudovibrio axinellae]|uniref:Putative xanthine dehydrogenase subunit A n=1 Tax=Pseudovibrio axinellae TaxID=989403 RepID=A0A165ZZZ6_9HYPH|nr:XdhC family protein [Pseudovibrio axinellae]KZL20474.1 putative xanthine dehydrogenase subunit A [Pseudovibrio axinellae]SEQ37583.1 xanthine dehydrogenase accessory factor [Pseudovibrio axinellae]